MTFSLQIASGDLVVQGSQMGIVYNTDKLKQDLTLWLSERYGIDRFHPAMGSNYQNYIGGIISRHTQATIKQETERVLDNYQRVQFADLRAAPTRFSLAELLWSINTIDVQIGFDIVAVGVNVSNAVQQPTTVTVSQGA